MSERKEGVFKIDIDNLLLDQYNPRLYGESARDNQNEIMAKIYQREQIDELASSLAVNGYFQEEPIIVIPQKVSDFELIDSNNLNDFKYTVIEGNRRTTSIKLLLNKDNKIVDPDFPEIKDDEIKKSLSSIPAIVYKNREDVDIYLSVRHISGNRKWDAFAKAKYIYEKVESLNETINNISKSIDKLSTQIGDKSNIIKKYYIYYKIFLQIEDDVLEYSSKNIKERFSLLEVALASGNTSIAKYIGLSPFRRLNYDETLIDDDKIDELKDVTEWIFGKDDQGSGSLINDSRHISQYLKPILANADATNYLKKYKDIDGAFQLTDGEENLIIGNIKRSNVLLSKILYKVGKYKDSPDFKGAFDELIEMTENIKNLTKK